jgi:hypothetical protein
MPKQMSEKTFSNLLDYYIACLEQEDLLSVTFNVSSENTSFLSTLFQTEVLFHTNNKRVMAKNTEGAKKFFQTSLLRQKNKTLFYGYPIVMNPQGTLSPLFFIELQYEKNDDSIILNNTTTEYTLNRHILIQQGFSTEEIINIQQEIKRDTFLSALDSICATLHFSSTDCTPTLDEKPLKRTITHTLVNKAIIYFADRPDITHNLLTELTQLKKKPFDELASTSLLLILTSKYPLKKISTKTPYLLEIFSLNTAQKNAVEQSLQNPLTVITGPPGTGKSQVVLNIIANAVYQNKTVLFASKNNKAVDVVLEKFNAILPYKLIVRMGNQEYRRNSKAVLEQLLKQPIQKIPSQEKTIQHQQTIASQMEHIQHQIFMLTSLNDSIEKIQDTLENSYEQYPHEPPSFQPMICFNNIDPLMLQDDLNKSHKQSTIFKRLNSKRYHHKQEIIFKKYYNRLPRSGQQYLQNMITNKYMKNEDALQWILTGRKKELAHLELQQIKKKLFTLPPYRELKNTQTQLQKENITLSQKLLQYHWITKFRNAQENTHHDTQTYFSASEHLESRQADQETYQKLQYQRTRAFQHLLNHLPIWVVTNLSAKPSFPLKNNLFDLLIIDEASQCDIPSALPLFYRAKHVIIIGDPHQLKHISLLTESQDQALAKKNHIPDEIHNQFSYTKQSLYACTEQILTHNHDHPIFLNEHYRCHPDIVSFSNEYYYDRKLTISTDESKLLQHPSFQTRLIWYHIKGKTIHAKSPYNEKEAERVVEELLKILETLSLLSASIGVVTLFRAQADIISEKLNVFQDLFETNITIGTAHRFQGDEKDIILFSPAVSEGIKPGTLQWIRTTRQLINVAITRARSLCIIIGDQEICQNTTGPLQDLSAYVQRRTIPENLTNHPTKQLIYSEAQKNNIPLIPHYRIKENEPCQIDFALLLNGRRYAIKIQDTPHDFNRKQLQSDGWKIRTFSEQDILHNLSEIIEELKRLC